MNMKEIECMSAMEAMTDEALDSLISKFNAEKERRQNIRCRELVEAVCNAMNALHKEFPEVELCIPFYCEYCECKDDIDILDHFHGTLTYDDFDYC